MPSDEFTSAAKITRIKIDGKVYSSVEEMPPEIRSQYENAMRAFPDRDGNGIPDVLDGPWPNRGETRITLGSVSKDVTFDGNVSEMSPEVRRKVEELADALARDETGNSARSLGDGTPIVRTT